MTNINNKITFIEGNVAYNNTNIDNRTFNENYKLLNNINFFNNAINTININIFIGNFSNYLNNELLNSSYYKKDRKYNEIIYTPFSENKRNNLYIETLSNPCIFRKTLGIDSSYYFDDYYVTPFNDVENIENNIEIYFKDKNKINFPYYYNALNTIDRNSEICITGILDELNSDFITERLLSKGIKCEIIGIGLDSRNRANNLSTQNINSNNLSEPFSDSEIENIVTGNDVLLKRKINYTTREINGIIYNVADYSTESNEFMPVLTNKMIYYSEDNNYILPFNDDILDEDIFNQRSTTQSTGSDFDKSYNSGYDSYTFLRNLD